MRRSLTAFLVIAIACCFASICRAEQFDNPRFAAWSKFNVGSSETLERITGEGDKQVTTDETRTLTEKTDDHVVIEIKNSMSIHGQAMPGGARTEVIQAKLDKQPPDKPAGEEKVDAAGKRYDCKVFQIIVPNAIPGRPDETTKLWVSTDVPGGVVKMEVSAFHGAVTSLLKSSEVK